MYRGLALVAAAFCAASLLAGCWPSSDSGYVQIKTVPVASVTQTALYLDSTKLAPIRQGSAILRQPVGRRLLQAAGYAPGALAPLCTIEVKRNRITTVTVSVLERPPRCQCRFTSTTAETERSCVS